MDNFFTSPLLFAHLRKLGIGAVGTTKHNRIGFPQNLKRISGNMKLSTTPWNTMVSEGVRVASE